MGTPAAECVFCAVPREEIALTHALALAFAKRDGDPLTKGHTLIIPRRHVVSFFDTTEEQRNAILALLDRAKAMLDREHRPDGYNIGINDGPAAGQTVMQLHIHIVSRYQGDKADPRDGIRSLFPEKAAYWKK